MAVHVCLKTLHASASRHLEANLASVGQCDVVYDWTHGQGRGPRARVCPALRRRSGVLLTGEHIVRLKGVNKQSSVLLRVSPGNMSWPSNCNLHGATTCDLAKISSSCFKHVPVVTTAARVKHGGGRGSCLHGGSQFLAWATPSLVHCEG